MIGEKTAKLKASYNLKSPRSKETKISRADDSRMSNFSKQSSNSQKKLWEDRAFSVRTQVFDDLFRYFPFEQTTSTMLDPNHKKLNRMKQNLKRENRRLQQMQIKEAAEASGAAGETEILLTDNSDHETRNDQTKMS